MKIKLLVVVLLLFQFGRSQSVTISGNVESTADVENIHVINTTAQKFTITDKSGAFVIPVRLYDTLKFSSVQHNLKTVVITKDIITSKTITVSLEEHITTLNQITVGKVLTGDLSSDIGNVEGKAPINFYDVGIPGYTGKLATQSERRLNEATTSGAGIPLNPIINAITGRTKMLKKRIAHERNDALIKKIRKNFSKSLFIINTLDETYRTDFFYFCEMDENFYKTCAGASDIVVLEFLNKKLQQYKANQNED